MTAGEPDWLHTIWSELRTRLRQMLRRGKLVRLDLKKPLAHLNPAWFALEASLPL